MPHLICGGFGFGFGFFLLLGGVYGLVLCGVGSPIHFSPVL